MARKSNNNLENMADYIQYLEKAIKHMEQLVALQSDAAKYSNYYQENMAEISKINEKFKANSDKARLQTLKEEVNLIKEKIKHQAELQAMQEIEIENAKELLNHEKNLKKTKNQRQKAYQDLDKFKDKEITKINKQGSGTRLSWNNVGDFLTQGWRNRTQEQLFNDYYNEALKKAKNSKGEIDTSAIKEDVLEQVAAGMSASSTKFNLAAGLIQAGADTFKAGVDKFVNLFKLGTSNQSNVFEKTFENISVRTGLTRGEYYNQQLGLNNELSELGLRNNLRSSEIMEMWNTIVDKGYSSEQSFANAIDTILTQKIVPYLDTTSSYFQQLSITNPELMKQIRGIGASTMELSGSSVFVNKYLQEMVDQLGPISEQASTDIGIDYAKASGYYEQLHAAGISDSTIGHMFYSAKQGVEDPYKIATSGSIDQKLAFYDVYRNGDLTSIADWAIAGGKSANMMANWVSGEGNQGALSSAVIASKTSLPYSAILELNRENPDLDKAESIANQITEILDKNADQVTKNYSEDKNQTNTTLQETTVENLANELAVGKEWMGHWTDLLIVAVKGVGKTLATILTAGTMVKGIEALSGLGGSSLSSTKGLGAALGKAGAIAGAVGAVALGISALNGWIRNQTNNNGNSANNNAGGFASTYTNVTDDKGNTIGDAESAGTIEAFGQQYGRSETTSKWKAGLWDNGWTNFWGSAGNAFNFNGYNEDNPADYNNEKWARAWAERKGLYDDETMAWVTATYAEAMLDAGNGADIFSNVFGGANITKEGLKAFFHKRFDDPDYSHLNKDANGMHQYAANILSSLDLYPVGPYRKYSDLAWSADDMVKWGVYRQGLNNVPYDDYPALLHQGEAVLTASTANELRNLVVEYRENNNLGASLDAIISNQTTILVEKMSEIIQTIQNLNSATTNTNNGWSSTVRTSMKNMISTKSF